MTLSGFRLVICIDYSDLTDWLQQLRGRSSVNRNPDGYEAGGQIQREEVSIVLSGGSN